MNTEPKHPQKALAYGVGGDPKEYKDRQRAKAAAERGDPHRRIPAGAVQQMCGDISAMTLHRWLNNPDLDFPKPQYIGRRRYWREADVIAWLESREVAA